VNEQVSIEFNITLNTLKLRLFRHNGQETNSWSSYNYQLRPHFRRHRMHDMLTIHTDVRGVCPSVCLSRGLNRRRRVQCTPRRVPCARGHSVQPSPNACGLLLFITCNFVCPSVCHISDPAIHANTVQDIEIRFPSYIRYADHVRIRCGLRQITLASYWTRWIHIALRHSNKK